MKGVGSGWWYYGADWECGMSNALGRSLQTTWEKKPGYIQSELENGSYRERLNVNTHLSSAVRLHTGLYRARLNVNVHLSSAVRLHTGLYRNAGVGGWGGLLPWALGTTMWASQWEMSASVSWKKEFTRKEEEWPWRAGLCRPLHRKKRG